MRLPGRSDTSLPLDYRTVLVPVVAGPRSIEAAHLAGRLAAGRRSRIVLLRVLVVPSELPLDAHLIEQTESSKRLLRECAAVVEAYGVKVEECLRRARTSGSEIVAQASERSADLVVLGAPRSTHKQIFGHTVHHVLKHSPSRVMVAAGKKRWLPFDESPGEPVAAFRRILVPMKVGPIGDEMLAAALKLATGRDVTVEVLHAINVPLEHALDADLPEQEERAAAAVETARSLGASHGVSVESAVVRTRSIGKSIVERSLKTDPDLVVLGSAPRWRRRSRFFSPTVDYVLRRSPAEVLILTFPSQGGAPGAPMSKPVAVGWAPE